MTKSVGLTVITGPSGVGKGTLVSRLLEKHKELWMSVSATTREPRKGENDGEHYFFLKNQDFKNLVDNNGFLEWAEFAGNCYGTPKEAVLKQLKKDRKVLLEIELEGARQVRKSFPEGFQIFIAPPSFDELENRIRGRGTESENSIQKRLLRASKELKSQSEFDAVVINDSIDSTVLKLEKLIGLI